MKIIFDFTIQKLYTCTTQSYECLIYGVSPDLFWIMVACCIFLSMIIIYFIWTHIATFEVVK